MKIHIEYCIKWNYHPEFDRVSKKIKQILPDVIIESNNTDPRTGSFEITLDGKLIYSKFKTNCFPSKEEIREFFA